MRNEYEVRGDITAIFMTYKKAVVEALVSTSDLPKLLSFDVRWKPSKKASGSGYEYDQFYAVATPKRNGKFEHHRLHRFIMDAPEGYDVDHRDGDPLNNVRDNLRVTTRQGNMQNRRGANRNSKSGKKNIRIRNGRYQARIKLNGKEKVLGTFDTEKEALQAVADYKEKVGWIA
jgi:hypothetical protein